MSICAACKAKLANEATSCSACGAPVQPDADQAGLALGVVCPSCHQYNQPGAVSCTECGASVAPAGFTGFLNAANIPAPPRSPKPEPMRPEAPQEALEQPGQRAAAGDAASGAASPGPGVGTMIFGALEAGRAKLVLLEGRGHEGSEFRLNSPSIGTGRSKGLILFPDDPCLADLHATFVYQGGVLTVRDEGHESGSWIMLREPTILSPGMEVAVGRTRLSVQEISTTYTGDGARPLGAEAPHGAVRVEEILSPEMAGRAWICPPPRATIGRGHAFIAIDDDDLVDEAHAEIRFEPRGLVLADLGSSNGTFLRAPPKTSVPLQHEDRVRIGGQILEVRFAGSQGLANE